MKSKCLKNQICLRERSARANMSGNIRYKLEWCVHVVWEQEGRWAEYQDVQCAEPSVWGGGRWSVVANSKDIYGSVNAFSFSSLLLLYRQLFQRDVHEKIQRLHFYEYLYGVYKCWKMSMIMTICSKKWKVKNQQCPPIPFSFPFPLLQCLPNIEKFQIRR